MCVRMYVRTCACVGCMFCSFRKNVLKGFRHRLGEFWLFQFSLEPVRLGFKVKERSCEGYCRSVSPVSQRRT